MAMFYAIETYLLMILHAMENIVWFSPVSIRVYFKVEDQVPLVQASIVFIHIQSQPKIPR